MQQEPHDPHEIHRHTVAAMSQGSPVTKVDIPVQMLRGPYALDNLADIGLAAEIQLLFAEHARAQSPYALTPAGLLQALRARGVRSGNGRSLIGRDAVYETFNRLRAKGFIQRIQTTDPETKQRTGIRYVFHELPAWNPDAPPVATEDLPNLPFPQVGATSGNAGYGSAGLPNPTNGTNVRSPQVGATSGNAGYGVPGSAASSQVGATSGNAGNPPRPPEGMGNPSPLPPTDSSRQSGAKDGPGQEFSEPEKQAASNVLQSLPGEPWNKVGPVEADNLALLLLERMTKQGWPKVTELPDSGMATLVECLTSNPGGIDNPVRILRTKRIPNLWRYRPTGTSSSSRGTSGSSLPPWCGKCNQGIKPSHVFERMVPLPDGSDDVDCPACHPRKVNASTAN